MQYLEEFVDHPLALIAAVVLSAPFLWQIAKSMFADIEEDVMDAAPYALIDLLGGPTFITWLPIKLIWFTIVSAAFIVMFYKLGAWLAEW